MLFNFEGTVKAALSATCGDNSEEDPPVPIPNTVVKLLSADDTWGVTLWEIRTSPLFSFFDIFSGIRGTLCLVNYRSTVLLNFYRFGQRYVVFFVVSNMFLN